MSNKQLYVLIIDDNYNFVDRMITLLNETDNIGFIDSAHDFEEATLQLTKKPDLVLLDISLPGKNGIQILRSIRESKNDCQVIMMSNHTGKYYRQECNELGADLFLDKTADFDMIPEIIRKLNPSN